MDVVFLFMSQSSAVAGSTPDNWEPKEPCADFYHEDFQHEGYFKLMGDLLDRGVIDKLSVFYESNRGPGLAEWIDHPNAFCAVIPEIRFAEPYIKEGTVVFVRGGFKHWHDWLMKYKNKNWLILYAANTGRGKWNWWDIILDDIGMLTYLDKYGRLYLPFIKPIDDRFFCPTPDNAEWDIMMGSSHIHDKKGQWRVLKVLEAYERRYQKRPTAILPGAPRRGEKTIQMLNTISKDRWDIPMPGHVSREELKLLYNRSRIALFLGAHGQNDRGPLEALACGTPVIIGSPEYHTLWLKRLPGVFALANKDKYDTLACILSFLNSQDYRANKSRTSLSFRNLLGYDRCYEWMREIFSFCSAYDPDERSKKDLRNIFRSFK